MAVVFLDGFDFYEPVNTGLGPPLSRKWLQQTSNGSIIAGRRNDDFSNNLGLNSGSTGGGVLSPCFGDQATCIIGFVFFVPSSFNNRNRDVMRFVDNGTVQCSLGTDDNGVLTLYLGTPFGTPITSGSTSIRKNIWYHIEIKLTINDTTGAVQLKLNEQDEIHSGGGPVTGLDTQTTTNASMNQIQIVGQSGNLRYYDDLYVLDTTASVSGPPNNDFIGDHMVETLWADGDGAHSDWTPNSGVNNYDRINEQAVDDDATYVFTNTISNIDTYTFDDLSQITQEVKVVQLNLQTRKTTGGDRALRSIIRHSGTDYPGIEFGMYDDWADPLELFPSNPGTGVSWTTTDIDGIEFGVEITG